MNAQIVNEELLNNQEINKEKEEVK
jgi:hypothetical protein